MFLDKTTARGFAAAIAFVIAGATLAGAAVFHVPVLGFNAAAASSTPTPVRKVVANRTIKPRRVVRVRYVDDVVHRPALVTAYSAAPVAVTYQAPAPVTATAPTMAVAVLQPSVRTATQRSAPDREVSSEAPRGAHGSTASTAPAHEVDE